MRHGFLLIELLIYLAVSSLIILVLSTSVLQSLMMGARSSHKAQQAQALWSSLVFFARDVRGGSSDQGVWRILDQGVTWRSRGSGTSYAWYARGGKLWRQEGAAKAPVALGVEKFNCELLVKQGKVMGVRSLLAIGTRQVHRTVLLDERLVCSSS